MCIDLVAEEDKDFKAGDAKPITSTTQQIMRYLLQGSLDLPRKMISWEL